MDNPATKKTADALTLRSIGDQIKQATDPILKQVEVLCVRGSEWNRIHWEQ